MKREIKFRAWDDKSKKMFNPLDDVCTFAFNLRQDYIHVMQFTGLKDVNGVDCYEDYIIMPEWSYKKFKIVFDKGCFYAECNNMKLKLSEVGNFVCIGNIYKNPELLNDAKD